MKSAIYHIKMPSQYLLTSTFLRFQEFYESPRFRGQGFTLEEFQDWYAETRPIKTFSYYDDWVGHNFPSSVVDNFTPDLFGVFSKKEHWVLDQLQHIEGKYYVIATFGDDTIFHEVVHGLFYLNEEYANTVAGIVQEYDLTEFKEALLGYGYCAEVLIDEINAYLLTGLSPFLVGTSVKGVKKCRPRLVKAFKATFGFDVSDSKAATEFAATKIHHLDGSSIRDVHDHGSACQVSA